MKVQAVAEGAGSRDPSKPGPKPHRVEQLVQNTGSTVGASSAAFDVYRASRRREFDRIEKLEQKVQDEQDGNAFSTKIETNKALADDKTSKNAAKRNKKKAKAKMMKAANPGGGGANDKTKEDALGEFNVTLGAISLYWWYLIIYCGVVHWTLIASLVSHITTIH